MPCYLNLKAYGRTSDREPRARHLVEVKSIAPTDDPTAVDTQPL
jgi:hypothetical protein